MSNDGTTDEVTVRKQNLVLTNQNNKNSGEEHHFNKIEFVLNVLTAELTGSTWFIPLSKHTQKN